MTWLVSVTIYCNFFEQQFTLPVFTPQYTFPKKLAVGNAHIEQIIEFELRGPGRPGRICTSTTSYFHDMTKQKSLKEYCRVNYFIICC